MLSCQLNSLATDNEMSDSNSVLTRIPAEIWRRILLEVMHIPYLLDATCTGSLFELWNALDYPEPRWRRSEWQRKLLRRVCKSWKHFAETQAYRSIDCKDCLKKPHILAHARRAQLTESLKHMFTVLTLWEVVEIDEAYPVDEFLVSIVQGYHPRLRRLNMHANMSIVYAACESAAFHQLTFLHLRFPTGSLQTATLIHTELPRLEVLIWEDFAAGFDPSSIFRLPTLHHFGWSNLIGVFPLSTFLSYARTLRSLSIRNSYWLRGYSVLPNLNELPCLEEFSIIGTFKIKDSKPFPPTYPLHTIYLGRPFSISRLVPCAMQVLDCNPMKLRRIHITGLVWEHGGEPENFWDHKEKIQILQLAEMCQGRGIRLEDSSGRVRCEMPPEVELRDFAIWCV